MPRFRRLTRIEAAFVQANRWFVIFLFAAMACLVFVNVALRYLTNQSIPWGEEVARHLMIWITFLGAGLALRFGGHVAIDSIFDRASSVIGVCHRSFVVVALALLFALMIYHGVVYAELMRIQMTPATRISFGWIYLALPLGFLLLLLHLCFIARRYVLRREFDTSPDLNAEAASL